ncbi:MAG: hypothetical protein NVS3B10_10910 [Polyangiales bacterium]
MASSGRPNSKGPAASQRGRESLEPAREGGGTERTPPRVDVRSLALRLGIPVALLWVIAFFVPHWGAKVGAGVLTIAALVGVYFILSYTRKAQRVQSIVGEAKTKEDRQGAIEQIDREFKKGDSAAIFAKSQLLMQEDPRKALDMLETIDLQKVMANVADEARAQRAMLHLMLGEPQKARPLADAVDLSRKMDPKSKATISSVVCEAWARTGQARKAIDILGLFDENDATIVEARPGLLRAKVFAYGAIDDLKTARGAMHQLAKMDPRIVAGFAQKGVHPLLVKEAKKILERSGAMPRTVMRGPMR